MRRNNWKSKVLIAIAFVLGVIAGLSAMLFLPPAFQAFKGLCFFGTLVIVSGGIVFIGVRIFGIGED